MIEEGQSRRPMTKRHRTIMKPSLTSLLFSSPTSYKLNLGGSLALLVKGGDSKSEGREFKSQRPILEGHFFAIICCKFVLFV